MEHSEQHGLSYVDYNRNTLPAEEDQNRTATEISKNSALKLIDRKTEIRPISYRTESFTVPYTSSYLIFLHVCNMSLGILSLFFTLHSVIHYTIGPVLNLPPILGGKDGRKTWN